MDNKRKPLLIAVCVVLLICVIAAGFAWFGMPKRDAYAEPVTIDLPPTISVLNNETGTSDILNLDGLRLGDTYNIVFSVTPSSPGITERFDLEVAFTTNLGAELHLYPAAYVGTTDTGAAGLIPVQSHADPNVFYYYQKKTAAPLAPIAVTTGKGYTQQELDGGAVQANNVARYQLYRDNIYLRFETYTGSWTESWDDEKRYLFYVLEIEWPTGSDASGMDAKETDLLYVTAKGR